MFFLVSSTSSQNCQNKKKHPPHKASSLLICEPMSTDASRLSAILKNTSRKRARPSLRHVLKNDIWVFFIHLRGKPQNVFLLLTFSEDFNSSCLLLVKGFKKWETNILEYRLKQILSQMLWTTIHISPTTHIWLQFPSCSPQFCHSQPKEILLVEVIILNACLSSKRLWVQEMVQKTQKRKASAKMSPMCRVAAGAESAGAEILLLKLCTPHVRTMTPPC